MRSAFALADLPTDSTNHSAAIHLRPYLPGDAKAFLRLNEAWIEKHFGMEEHDREILGDPEGYVLAKDGHIYFAASGEEQVGCCALIPIEPEVYEVAKMAVAEEWQGRGIGRRVLAYTIEQARLMGAKKLYLETNSSLANAIHLYEALGFRRLSPRPSPYARANVFMELVL